MITRSGRDFLVSVPLRGITFLNDWEDGEEKWKLKFPSPYGELHFSIINMMIDAKREEFPSPYGELHFSIQKLTVITLTAYCFRPLTGNYISQYG